VEVFPLVLFAHWLGDFAFQSKWMATNKKLKCVEGQDKDSNIRGRLACAAHSYVYGLCFGVVVMFMYFTPIQILTVVLFTALTHYPVDRSDFFIKRFEAVPNWMPPLYICFDNGIHVFLNYFFIKLLMNVG